jgi:hypothetical protein
VPDYCRYYFGNLHNLDASRQTSELNISGEKISAIQLQISIVRAGSRQKGIFIGGGRSPGPRREICITEGWKNPGPAEEVCIWGEGKGQHIYGICIIGKKPGPLYEFFCIVEGGEYPEPIGKFSSSWEGIILDLYRILHHRRSEESRPLENFAS